LGHAPGAEIDLVMIKNGHMLGVECKRVDAPRLTPSMRIALEDLKLERIAVVYPGQRRFHWPDRSRQYRWRPWCRGMSGVFPG